MGSAAPQATNIGEKAGCGGCLFPIVLLVAALGTGYYFYDIHGVQMLHAGDRSRFDPIDGYDFAETLAGDDLKFFRMTARFVRSDGTMDLTADYEPTTTYQWVGASADGERLPVGAGGPSRVSVVTVRATDFGFEHTASLPDGTRYYDLNMGLRRRESWMLVDSVQPTSPPRCSLAELWSKAIAKGAPGDAVAVVHHDVNGYDFDIEGTGFEMSFGHDCEAK